MHCNSETDFVFGIKYGHSECNHARQKFFIVDADTILVLSKGMIAEHGTHETLLAQQGIYNRLWATQQRDSNHEEMGQ